MKEVILLDSEDSAYDCPFDAELWTTGEMLPRIDPDCTKVFIFGKCSDMKDALDIAFAYNIPIVSTEDYATEEFPSEKIKERFKIDYCRSPMSYMMAYALYKGYEKIGIYGVDRKTRDNADLSRITYWLGVAKGMGVVYEIANTSRLYRVIRDNIKDHYLQARALRDDMREFPEDFVDVAESGNDPFCWVGGVDKDAITVQVSGIEYGSDKVRVLSTWSAKA